MDEDGFPAAVPQPQADFVMDRVLPAARERVFGAFTEAAWLKRWWAPPGFELAGARMDLRPGGSYHYALHAVDGFVLWGKLFYREIEPPQLLVYVSTFSNPAGTVAPHPLDPTWPRELLTTLSFAEHVEGTLVMLRCSLLPAATEDERITFERVQEDLRPGWSDNLERLERLLQGS